MTERIAQRQTLIHELEGALAQVAAASSPRPPSSSSAEARRADQAEPDCSPSPPALEDAEQRAAEAIVLAAELEQEINDLKAELPPGRPRRRCRSRKHA